MRTFVWILCVAACSPRAVTPPTRTFVMDSPSAPAVGRTDVQLDAASIIGEMLGPHLVGGDARLRHTVEPGVAVEADGGVLHVTNNGGGGDRNGYTGRLGVLLHSQDRHWGFGAGVGGGLSPTAGTWGAADVHGVVAGANRHVRPMLGAGLGYSGPLGHHTFNVTLPGEPPPGESPPGESPPGTTLQLPHNAIAQLHAGIELGPPDTAVILGLSLSHFWLREDSQVGNPSSRRQDNFAALGIGLRIALD